MDDVLNDLMHSWFEQKWTKERGDCKLKYLDITENPPHRLLGVSIEEYLNSLDEFRLSPLYQQMSPAMEVMEWFSEYGKDFRHIALTAVPLTAASASAQWVFKHFGIWIRTFHFVPSKRKEQNIPDYDNDKAAFLEWLSKVDVLIDDSPVNVNAAENMGIKGILWPRPWNNSKLTTAETLRLLENFQNTARTSD